MKKTYEITFVSGLALVLALTELELSSMIKKYKIRGYKKIIEENLENA